MRIKHHLPLYSSDMQPLSSVESLRSLLENVKKNSQGGLQIIACGMTNIDPGYKRLKWLSETPVGILTQCCLSSHTKEVQDQYLVNLALKINAKVGQQYRAFQSTPLF